MNRNNEKILKIKEIAKILNSLNSEEETEKFLQELLTNAEIETLSKRWRVLEMLTEGYTQRAISQDLKVSLCKVTRGSRILKDSKSILAKHLTSEKRKWIQ